MAPGDHHGAVGTEVVRREIEHRRGPLADVDDIRPGLDEPLHQRSEEPRRREAAVAADRDAERLAARRTLLSEHGAEAAADAMRNRIAQIAVGDSSDVVFAENVTGNSGAHPAHQTAFVAAPQGQRGRDRPRPRKLRSLALDAPAALPPSPQEAPYVYAATDLRPRQTREIELCEKASHFDWQYTGAFALGFGASIYLNIDRLKHTTEPALRLLD